MAVSPTATGGPPAASFGSAGSTGAAAGPVRAMYLYGWSGCVGARNCGTCSAGATCRRQCGVRC